MGLRDQAINSAFWGTINSVGNQGIQFIFGLILARLLSPTDYSVLAILTIFLTLSSIFVDSGMGLALIRKNKVSNSEYATVFYFNIAVACLFYLCIFLFSNIIEGFFEIEGLALMVKIFSLKIVLESFAMIQSTILIKNLAFKKIASISISSGIVSGIVGIYFAYNDFKAWALIYQTLTYSTLFVLLHWKLSDWRPQLIFSINDFKRTFNYSSKLLGASLSGRIANEINNVIIGKYLPPASLGLYNKANSFKNLPSNVINTVITKVSLPVLAQLEKDSLAYKDFVEKIIKTTCFLSFGILLLMVAIAPNFIPFLIGEQWSESIIIFQLIAFIGMIYPLQALAGNIMNSHGRSDLILKFTSIKSIFYIIIPLIAVLGGLKMFAISMSMLALGSFIFSNYFLRKVIDITTIDQVLLIWKFVITFAIGACITWYVGSILQLDYFIELLIQITMYGVLTISTSFLLKLDALTELLSIFKTLINRK